jgi:hypothetical protein
VTAVQAVVAEKGLGSPGLLSTYLDLIRREMASFQASAPEDAAVSIADFDACFHAALATSPRDGVSELQGHLAASQTGKRLPWQDCLIALALRDVMRGMWTTLSDQEKQECQSQHATVLSTHANSMPASSAEDVLGYIRDRDCSLRGALQSVQAEEGGGFLLRFSDSSPAIPVDYVINAAGFGKHFTTSAPMSALHLRLSQGLGGLVQPCAFGGLRCDFLTGRLQGEEEGSPLLYAAGHLVSGTKLLTSGISFCLVDGGAAVDDMLRRLKEE